MKKSDFNNKLIYRIKVLKTGIEKALILDDINEIKKVLSNAIENVPTTLNGKWQKIQQDEKV
jgi:hypothetical protein